MHRKKCPTLAHSDDLKEINLHLFFSFQIRERGRQKLFNPGKSQKMPITASSSEKCILKALNLFSTNGSNMRPPAPFPKFNHKDQEAYDSYF